MSYPCGRWPYPCSEPLTSNPTFDLLFGIAWICAMVWSLNRNSGRKTTTGVDEPMKEAELALRRNVFMAALFAPLVVQIGSCALR